jgi:hypothetical protein
MILAPRIKFRLFRSSIYYALIGNHTHPGVPVQFLNERSARITQIARRLLSALSGNAQLLTHHLAILLCVRLNQCGQPERGQTMHLHAANNQT